jgi:hypothetical protein
MYSSDLIRSGGLAAMLGAALLLISDLLGLTLFSGDLMEVVTTGAYLADGLVRLLAGVLLLLGLVGLYARQSAATGVPALIAFLLAFAGTALILGTWWTNTFAAPTLATEAPAALESGPAGTLGLGFMLSFALGAVGWLLFGLVSFRAGVYPRAAAGALAAGAILTFVPLPGAGAVFYVAVAWLGFVLFTQKEASAGGSERVK